MAAPKAFADFSFTAGTARRPTGTIRVRPPSTHDGIDTQVPVGTYSVVEVGTRRSPATAASYANSLNANTNCTSLAADRRSDTTCTITNNDNAPSR